MAYLAPSQNQATPNLLGFPRYKPQTGTGPSSRHFPPSSLGCQISPALCGHLRTRLEAGSTHLHNLPLAQVHHVLLKSCGSASPRFALDSNWDKEGWRSGNRRRPEQVNSLLKRKLCLVKGVNIQNESRHAALKVHPGFQNQPQKPWSGGGGQTQLDILKWGSKQKGMSLFKCPQQMIIVLLAEPSHL